MGNSFITIVSGLPRTGTSMMMKMLEAGGIPAVTDNIRQADIDNPGGYYEFELVKKIKDDVSWVADTQGKVFKMVSMLLYDLPGPWEYKIVFMERDMDEMLASQNKMLARRGEKVGTPDEDARMKKLYTDHVNKLKGWLASQKNVRTLFVSYNAAMTDPAGTANTVAEFIGGLDAAAMAGVVSPELYRNRA